MPGWAHALQRFDHWMTTDGLYRLSHHPSYLGEMMLYTAYALLAHRAPQ